MGGVSVFLDFLSFGSCFLSVYLVLAYVVVRINTRYRFEIYLCCVSPRILSYICPYNRCLYPSISLCLYTYLSLHIYVYINPSTRYAVHECRYVTVECDDRAFGIMYKQLHADFTVELQTRHERGGEWAAHFERQEKLVTHLAELVCGVLLK